MYLKFPNPSLLPELSPQQSGRGESDPRAEPLPCARAGPGAAAALQGLLPRRVPAPGGSRRSGRTRAYRRGSRLPGPVLGGLRAELAKRRKPASAGVARGPRRPRPHSGRAGLGPERPEDRE